MLLASYVDDDVGWVVPLWTEDDPASSFSTSAKMTQNRKIGITATLLYKDLKT